MAPGPEDEVSQAEKRRIIREQASTMHQHALSQAADISGGRFAATGVPNVVGSTPVSSYPAASTPFRRDPVPDEPPLGYRIDAMPPLESSAASPVEVGAPAAIEAPSSGVQVSSPADDVETIGTGAPPSLKGSGNG